MGKIICEKHGARGIALVCADIRKHIESTALEGDYQEVSDPEIPELRYYLCPNCYTQWATFSFEQTPLEPVCGACFNETRGLYRDAGVESI